MTPMAGFSRGLAGAARAGRSCGAVGRSHARGRSTRCRAIGRCASWIWPPAPDRTCAICVADAADACAAECLLVDHDPAAARAGAEDGRRRDALHGSVDARRSRPIFDGRDLVTASALLDLVSEPLAARACRSMRRQRRRGAVRAHLRRPHRLLAGGSRRRADRRAGERASADRQGIRSGARSGCGRRRGTLLRASSATRCSASRATGC